MVKALQILSITLVAGLAVGLSACSTAANYGEDSTIETQKALASISGNWQLETIATQGHSPKPPTVPITLTLQVEASDAGRLHGNSGCNRFFGAYQIEGGALKVGPMASTMMACEQPLMSQERDFLQMLEQLTEARLTSAESAADEDQLSLFDAGHATQLILRPLQETSQ